MPGGGEEGPDTHSRPHASTGHRGLDLHHGGDRSLLEGLSSPLEGLIPLLEGLHVLLTLQDGKWVLLWRTKYIQ